MKPDKFKSTADRRHEVNDIISKLRKLGLNEMSAPPLGDAIRHMERFVEDGLPFTQEYRLTGLKRVLCLKLANRKTTPCSAELKFNKHI